MFYLISKVHKNPGVPFVWSTFGGSFSTTADYCQFFVERVREKAEVANEVEKFRLKLWSKSSFLP